MYIKTKEYTDELSYSMRIFRDGYFFYEYVGMLIEKHANKKQNSDLKFCKRTSFNCLLETLDEFGDIF